MTTYNVHIYREMRLVFRGIEADSHEVAAAIARDKPTDDADDIHDCEGRSFSALVDVPGDEDYEQSAGIDFQEERQHQAAPKLLDALRWITRCPVISGPVGTTAYIVSDERMARARTAVAEAEAAGLAPAAATAAEEHPSRFEIEHDPKENPDRVYVLVDGKFDVAIIRTNEGILVDVYPKDEFEAIATAHAFDSDVESGKPEEA